MTKTAAQQLKRGDQITVTKDEVTFVASILDKDDNALSFMETINDNAAAPKRVGIVQLK